MTESMIRHRLLIDTDPGVDDALALLMAYSDPSVEVVALSLGAGNVGLGHTFANASCLLDLLGAQTPIYRGCERPLLRVEPDAAFVHGRDGFGDTGMRRTLRRAEPVSAAEGIVALARRHPGELTLVALGPLTNVALALRLEPRLPQLFRRCVIMGGAVNGRGNIHRLPVEFNIGFDPEAAEIVFSGWPDFELVDWEAVLAHGIEFDTFERWLDHSDERARFYRAISARTLDFTRRAGRGQVLLADALAMLAVLQPDAVTRSAQLHVAVETEGGIARGQTVVDWDRRGPGRANARVALELDRARFARAVQHALGAAS